jgi:hypothetical protein
LVVFEDVLIDKVEVLVPPAGTETSVALNVTASPTGETLDASETDAEKPATLVRVTVETADDPAKMLKLDGLAEIEKP